MISPDVEVTDIDAEAWGNLLRLCHLAAPDPDAPPRDSPSAGSPPVILFVHGTSMLRAVRLGGGVVPSETVPWDGPTSLPHIRRRLGAPLVLALEEGAVARAMAAAEPAVRHHDDLVAQALALGSALRARLGRDAWLEGDPLAGVPLPSYQAVQRTFDALFPDGHSAALFVLERGRPHASLIVLKEEGDLTRVSTHDALPPLPSGLDLVQAHRRLVSALRRTIAEPSCAATLEASTWRRIERSGPGATARALAAGEIVLDPAPPWLLTLIGAGAAYGVAREGARFLGRMMPASVRGAASGIGNLLAGSAGPFAALGFDPVSLFRRLRPLLR